MGFFGKFMGSSVLQPAECVPSGCMVITSFVEIDTVCALMIDRTCLVFRWDWSGRCSRYFSFYQWQSCR